MRYLTLCTDYDGTLATDGRVLPETVSALERLRASGRRIVLVTGRELDELQEVCPHLDLFDYVVAENGALLYRPSTHEETPLAPRPPDSFVAALEARGVGPISVGRVIVATWEPHETTVLATIRDLGLELQVIFNKGAVMILPAGVNKATGLAHALEKMQLSPRNAVGIGDAENDHALLAYCECSAAVANALPTLKDAADIVTTADHGAGVVELIEELLRDDLAAREPQLGRHHALLGTDAQGQEIRIAPYGETVVVIGTGGSGKSELTTALLEQVARLGYTFCVIDVEGDYGVIGEAVSLGSAERPPTAEEILKLLRGADQSAVVNLAGLSSADRASFLQALTPRLAQLRTHSGHPHWLAVDETQHLQPGNGAGPDLLSGGHCGSSVHIAPSPIVVAQPLVTAATLVLAVGPAAPDLLREFCQRRGAELPHLPTNLEEGTALAWRPAPADARPFRPNIAPAPVPKVAEGTIAAVHAPTGSRVAKTRTCSQR